MSGAAFEVMTGSRRRQVALADYLDARCLERAAAEAYDWIKGLRHAVVDGQPLRRRFTFRGDSLWWFAEIYLHKEQRIAAIFRTLSALDALVTHERPDEVRLLHGERLTRLLAQRLFEARGVKYSGTRPSDGSRLELVSMEARAWWLHHAALASRLRARRPAAPARVRVAAFVHRAFWRADTGEGSAEAYIGPVLDALERRVGREEVACVSLGPSSNFIARRWWHALRGPDDAGAIESYAPLARLSESRSLWRERYHMRRALWNSGELRQLSTIRGCDCWPIVRMELSGIALLQWPWSARAMDEAAAALDTLRPAAAVTYAEAGGWGRAVILECRRRGIRSIGIQHGFIYRHWLNYLHEPDEMRPDPANTQDAGFPRPSLTLLFDGYASEHLVGRGRFPPASLAVTGSARLDALVREARTLSGEDVTRARREAGCAPGETLVLVAAKHREAQHVLAPFVARAAALPAVRLAIKTHPAETPDVYTGMSEGRAMVTVLPSTAPLAPLLLASRAIVTMNSTVALDAAVLDIPALVIGLPNNLSPFVDAGIMAGADQASDGSALARILYDEEFRQQLGRARKAFLARYRMDSDGRAADRAADAVLGDA